MKGKKIIGLSIDNKEKLSIHKVKMDDKTKELLEKIAVAKWSLTSLQKHFTSNENFNRYYIAFYELINKSIPSEVERKCKICLKESTNESDRACTPYRMQMEMTFLYASQSFDSIIEGNRQVFTDTRRKNELAQLFFSCLFSVKEKGMLYLDLSKLTKYSLEIGFLSLADAFKQNDKLQSLNIINDTLDKIETFQLTPNLKKKETIIYPKKQKKFFEQKGKYLKEKIKLENKTPSVKTTTQPRSLKDLFIELKSYNTVINTLETERLIIKTNEGFKWNGYKNNPKKELFYECAELKSIQALGINLKLKNYLKPNTKNTSIANALSILFDINIVISTYNKVHKELHENSHSLYYKLFEFIPIKH